MSDAPNRRTQLIVLGVLAVLILIAAIVISQSGSDEGGSGEGSSGGGETSVEEALAGIPQAGVLLGDDSAPIVTEFIDLQCPFCAEFSTEAFNDVVEEHVRPGEILYELRVISFLGEDSREAAEMAAAAALQNKLYEFTETFYLNQGEESSGYVTEEFLTKIAEQTPGLDVDKALATRTSPAVRALMAQNETRAKELGIGGTPTFVLSQGDEPTTMQMNALTPEGFSEALAAARGE